MLSHTIRQLRLINGRKKEHYWKVGELKSSNGDDRFY